MSKEKNEFSEKYEVEGSPASQQMKTFMFDFNSDLQKIFSISVGQIVFRRLGAGIALFSRA